MYTVEKRKENHNSNNMDNEMESTIAVEGCRIYCHWVVVKLGI